MIYLEKQRIVILTPPKCGTHSLHAALCREPHGGVTVIGPSMNGRGIDRHATQIPNEAEDCQIVAVVRNPFDRLVSLWHHLVRFDAYHGRATMAFYIFAAHVGRRDTNTIAGDPMYGWNLCDYLAGVPERTKFVKLESLREDLAALGILIDKLPHELASHRRPWREYYDAGLVATVEPWARPDCERFGYA
jgi:hypothetical protein